MEIQRFFCISLYNLDSLCYTSRSEMIYVNNMIQLLYLWHRIDQEEN